jgi:hypothetical protein
MQMFFAGQQTPEALRTVFSHDVPDETPDDAIDDAFTPKDWDLMLRDAYEHDILSYGAERAWRVWINRNLQRFIEDRRRNEEEQSDSEDSEGE